MIGEEVVGDELKVDCLVVMGMHCGMEYGLDSE